MLLFLLSAALAAPLPDLDRPLKSGAQQPDDAAVVVGIEDYYELPDVPFAERDAQAFHDFLLYTRGVPPDRIDPVPKANREKLLSAVEDAAALAGADGTVWVYFAGHGGASPQTGERVLMGIDVQPDLETFTARSVTVAELRELASSRGSRVVLVLDTCYTGQGRSGAELLPGKRFAVPAYATEGAPRILEWSAADANQFSGPLTPAGHGAFTYAVLGALRGWADGQLDDERDGVVTALEARLYVEEALRTLGVRDQDPVMVAEGEGDWVLAAHPRAEPAPELTLDAMPPQPAAADAETLAALKALLKDEAKAAPEPATSTKRTRSVADDGSVVETTTVTDGSGKVLQKQTVVVRQPKPQPLASLPDRLGACVTREGVSGYYSCPRSIHIVGIRTLSTPDGFDHADWAELAVSDVPRALDGLSVRRRFVTTLTMGLESGEVKKDKYQLSVFDASRGELYECDYLDPPHGLNTLPECLKYMGKLVAARSKL